MILNQFQSPNDTTQDAHFLLFICYFYFYCSLLLIPLLFLNFLAVWSDNSPLPPFLSDFQWYPLTLFAHHPLPSIPSSIPSSPSLLQSYFNSLFYPPLLRDRSHSSIPILCHDPYDCSSCSTYVRYGMRTVHRTPLLCVYLLVATK